tara:strand:+ start:657 stop:2264 length:1608 start_codon:yes stop_codon:yes gene_type:complete
MPSLFKEIFQQVFRRFVKDRGRFPTPAERDVLQDIAQKEARKQMENIDPVFKGVDKMDPDKPFRGFKPKVVPKVETEAEILARMNRQNKEAVERLRKKKQDREDFSIGGGVMKIIKALAKKSPLQRYKDYLASVKRRAQTEPEKLAPELGAVAGGGILVNRQMKRILEEMKEQDKEINLENFKQELENDPFYQERPELKDKVLEKYVETMFGEEKANGGRIGFSGGGAGLPAATGGQTVFMGPTLPEEEDEEEIVVQDPGPTAEEIPMPMFGNFETNDPKEAAKRILMEYSQRFGTGQQSAPLGGGINLLFGMGANRPMDVGLGMQKGNFSGGIGSLNGNVSAGINFKKSFQEGGPVDPDRRTFVKILGGLASIPILGKFVAPLKQAAPVIAETAKEVPAYFFKLVDKIRRLGKDAPGLTDIERTTGKKYKNYEMVEDQTTGDIIIKKQKQGSTMVGDDMVEGTMSEEVLAYRTPKNTPEGRLPADYEEITVKPDFEGKMRDVEDGLDSMSEILEEVGETQLKKASGGLAYMLGE